MEKLRDLSRGGVVSQGRRRERKLKKDRRRREREKGDRDHGYRKGEELT